MGRADDKLDNQPRSIEEIEFGLLGRESLYTREREAREWAEREDTHGKHGSC